MRPRLVFLCTRFPYPFDRGDRLRSYNLLRQLSRHTEITLVSFTDGEPTEAPVDRLLEFCSRVEVIPLSRRRSQFNMLGGVFRNAPFQVSYYRSDIMSRLVDRLRRERFDIAFAHLFRMRPYLEPFTSSLKVIDLCDSLTLNLQRALPNKPFHKQPAFREELRRVDHYERDTLKQIDEAWVIADDDRGDLLRRAPGAPIQVVPNGIVERWGAAGLDGPKEDVVLFLGNLTVGHNIDAANFLAREIWPLVSRRKPGARLVFVGAHGRGVASLADLPGVTLTGFVDDLTPLIRSARLSAAPLRYGAGIQNKVLELMSTGLPCVVTPIVAAPIGAEPGRDILVGETAGELADHIATLLSDDDAARRVGRSGRRLVTSRFNWSRVGERMRQILM